MLTLQKPSLQQTLIELLATCPGSTAHLMKERAASLYRSCSIQAIYKELRGLISRGVIVKAGNAYSLSLAWILNSSEFIDRAYERLMEYSAQSAITDGRHLPRRWRFNDLRRADDFWVQTMLALLQSSRTKTVFSWLPHTWFDLINHEKDVRYQNALRATGRRHCAVIGSASMLDQRTLQNWPQDVYYGRIGPDFFKNSGHIYTNVIGDFILTIRMDKRTAAAIERCYQETSSEDTLDIGRILTLLSTAHSCTLTLESDEIKASRLTRKFQRFFDFPVSK